MQRGILGIGFFSEFLIGYMINIIVDYITTLTETIREEHR